MSSRDSDGSKLYSQYDRESDTGQMTSIFDKLSMIVKSKTSEVKEKLAEMVASRDKYKGISIFDDDNNDEFNFEDIVDEVDSELNVDQWAREHESLAVFPCKELEDHKFHDRSVFYLDLYFYLILSDKLTASFVMTEGNDHFSFLFLQFSSPDISPHLHSS